MGCEHAGRCLHLRPTDVGTSRSSPILGPVDRLEELFERPGPGVGRTRAAVVRALAVKAKEHQMGWGADKGPDRGEGNKVGWKIVRRG